MVTNQHRRYYSSASSMAEVDESSVQLIITSPPYPMIEMWDDQFSTLDPSIGLALENAAGSEAFRRMHDLLLPVWEECYRVLQPGGIACINIGDATRNIDGRFQLFPNHARIVQQFAEIGFYQLPSVIWRKPANSTAKFMGSGMLGVNAYITLEHEYILIFRKGSNRNFSPEEAVARRKSAYFWEERNRWFTDVWMDLRGVRQHLSHRDDQLRERSAAFPLELPLRLIEMFSIYGDYVLDPFLGTGTTALAAAISARNSIGYEIEESFSSIQMKEMDAAIRLSRERNQQRTDDHITFIERREGAGKPLKHLNTKYGFGVISRQECEIEFFDVDEIVSENEMLSKSIHSSHQLRRQAELQLTD